MPDDRAEADEKDKGKRAESDDDEEEIDRPIPTVNGGYSHTKSSKRKIGQANKGKTPWNKGQGQSPAVSAKISAALKARNRRILLEKIAKTGLSEVDYEEQKRKEKVERQRARRHKERLLKEQQQNKKKQDKVSTEETTKKTAVTTTIAEKQPKSTTNKKSPTQSSKSKTQQKVISSSETSGKSSAVTNSIPKPETVCSFDDDFQISPSASSDIKSPNEQKSSSKTATSSVTSTTAHTKGVNNVLKAPLQTLPSTGLDILIVGGICDDEKSNKSPTSEKYSQLLANCFLKSTNHHPSDPESSTKAEKKKENQSTKTAPLLDSVQKFERNTFIQSCLSAKHIYIAESISSFFHGDDEATENQHQNDITNCDDDDDNDGKKKSSSNNTTENTTSLINRTLIDKEALQCLLCRHQFRSLNHLDRHLKLSQLHKSNLEKFMKEQGGKRIEKEVENNQRLQEGQAEEEASNSIEQQANDQDQQPFSKKRKLSVVDCANNNSSTQKHVQQPRIDFIVWVMSASDLINLSSQDNEKKVFLDRMYTHNLSPNILHSDYIYLKRIIIVVISSPEEERTNQGSHNVLMDLLHKYENNLDSGTSLLKKWIIQDHLIPVYQCTNTENSLFHMSKTIMKYAKLSSRASLTSETNASSVTVNAAKTSDQSEAKSDNQNFGDSAGLSPLFYSVLFQ